MRHLVIFNPGSGKRSATSIFDAVMTALRSTETEITTITFSGAEDFEVCVREATAEHDCAIVIGGDGTLSSVANAVLSSPNPRLPIALVPAGRGKDAARSLTAWSPESVGSIGQARKEYVDLIRIGFADGSIRHAVNVASIGLGATAANFAQNVPRWLGTTSYILGAMKGLSPPHPFQLRMTIDNEIVSIHNALLVSVCNGMSFGGGIHIAPKADPHDGLLDIVVAHNANLGDLFLQLPKLRAGTLLEHRALSRWQAQSIQIEYPTGTPAEADGEVVSLHPVAFECVPNALTWLMPS